MSTIHSALEKAQKEQDARKGPFPGSGGPQEGPGRGKGKRVIWIVVGVVLIFLVGYSGFLIAGRLHGPDSGKMRADATPPVKNEVQAPEEEMEDDFLQEQEDQFELEEQEEAPANILDRNGRPYSGSQRPVRGQLVARAEEQPKTEAAKETEARARALVESQALWSENQEPFAPKRRRPEGMEEGRRPRYRRENAWTMAKENERFASLPGFDKMDFKNTPRRRGSFQEDNLREEPVEPAAPVEPEVNEDPPAIVASRWYSKGLDSQMLGRMDEARAYYTRSLIEDPTYAPSLNNRAVIDMENGRMEEAKDGFIQAMTADSAYVDPCYNLACLYAREGALQEAVKYLKMAVNMDKAVLDWAEEDQDLAVLKDMDEFKEVMND